MSTWVKFHRKIEQWEWYTDANTFRVFFHLVMKANWEDVKWQGVDIKRGQHVTSPDKIATSLGLTRQKVRTALEHLESTNEITIKTTNKFTVVTIENFDYYQSKEDEATNKSPSKQQTNNQRDNHQLTTNKNNKENKEEKENKYTTDYKKIFDHYISLGLIAHRILTESMKKGIDTAIKDLKCDEDHLIKLLDRHKQKVESTKNNGEYKTTARGLDVFFGQKKYKSSSLICSDYDDGVWIEEQEKTVKKQITQEEFMASYAKGMER